MLDNLITLYIYFIIFLPICFISLAAVVAMEKVSHPKKTIKQILREL